MAHVLVPYKQGRYIIQNGTGPMSFSGHEELEEHLATLGGGELIGLMGGPGQAMFARAQQLGFTVSRIPWFRLQQVLGQPITGADELERATAIEQAWQVLPESFYTARDVDERIFMVRELTRVRLSIQETYRKPAQLQYQATFRDLAPLLPAEGRLARLRTTFAEPAMIAGAKADEKELEGQIKSLVSGLPIWEALHPARDGVLPRIKGLGPSIGGSLIGEIGDIRRFERRENLRAYARTHVDRDGRFPRRRAGEVANWNNYLDRAVWLWSSDQMARYADHIWRQLYDWRKARELQNHPQVELRPRAHGEGMAKHYTLGHLDKRAKRWVGSKLLNYVFDLWWALADGRDPEAWYLGSNWPNYFASIERELDDGLLIWLHDQIDARKSSQAGEVEESTEE